MFKVPVTRSVCYLQPRGFLTLSILQSCGEDEDSKVLHPAPPQQQPELTRGI